MCLKKVVFIGTSAIVKVLSAGIKVFRACSNARSSEQKDAYLLQSTLEIPKHLASLMLSRLGHVDLILLETQSGLWRTENDGYWE